jgi:ADP-ribose pyrophosphatase YjhB (NUDIX family)
MKFCSECGSRVARQWVADEGRERHVCTTCRIVHYENPRIIVSCSVCWDGKVLLCRRSQEPARGKWNVPSGYLECGETLEQGAARETLEETGVRIDPAALELHGVINMVDINQVAVGFRVEVFDKPILRPGPECLEAAFFAEEEFPQDELAWRLHVGKWVPGWFNEIRSRDYSILLGTLGSGRGGDFKSRLYRIKTGLPDGAVGNRPVKPT